MKRDACTFRLERFDEKGDSLPAITVEIRSVTGFAGDLSEGDKISVYEQKRAATGGIVTAAVRNVSTGGIFGKRDKVDARRIDVPPVAPSGGAPSPQLDR
jgi:hypothetical protein